MPKEKTTTKTILKPRITVQFEISGDEDVEYLGFLKSLEKAVEIELAKATPDILQNILENTMASIIEIRDGNGESVPHK